MLRHSFSCVLLIFLIFALKFDLIFSSCSSSRAAAESDCYLNHLARENVVKMGMQGGCEAPKPQIVYPQDPEKTFMPRGTILYRCNDQAGCCPQKEHSCQPVSEEEIRVAFYALNCGMGDKRPTPEYVQMKNHTRCSCQPKNEDYNSLDPRMSSPQRLVDAVCGSSQRSSQRQQSYGGQSYYDLQGSSYGQSMAYNQRQQSMPCQRNSQSTRPLIDGQVVRGTIQLTVTGKRNQGCNG